MSAIRLRLELIIRDDDPKKLDRDAASFVSWVRIGIPAGSDYSLGYEVLTHAHPTKEEGKK